MMKTLEALGRPPVVLVADDDDDHVFLTRMAFDEARAGVDLHDVPDGERCLAFLRRQPPYENAPRPDLLLLDLHMPRIDGAEVMREILADPALRRLPVVVMSTSVEAVDLQRMYEMRCNAYIAKPLDLDRFMDVVARLSAYWFGLVVLPTGDDRVNP